MFDPDHLRATILLSKTNPTKKRGELGKVSRSANPVAPVVLFMLHI